MKLIQSNRPLMMDVFHPQFVNRFFDGMFDEGGHFENNKSTFRPAAEMLQTPNEIVVTLALPGMKKEDVKIELENNTIVVSGERKSEMKTEDDKRFYTEMAYGKFRRAFALKEDVNRNEISAEFTDGMLKMSLPLKEKEGCKAIEIK